MVETTSTGAEGVAGWIRVSAGEPPVLAGVARLLEELPRPSIQMDTTPQVAARAATAATEVQRATRGGEKASSRAQEGWEGTVEGRTSSVSSGVLGEREGSRTRWGVGDRQRVERRLKP